MSEEQTVRPHRICPHCRKNVEDLEDLDPRERYVYLKSMLKQFYEENSPIGKMVFGILAAVSELQATYQSERIKAGLAMARERGKKLGRPKIIADYELIYRLFDDGVSCRAIARETQISPRTVRRIIHEKFRRGRVQKEGEEKNQASGGATQ